MISYVVTFLLSIATVGLWTVRVALTARGGRVDTAVVSMVEATLYVVVVSRLVGSLDAPIHMVVYSIGVGIGTYVGLTLDALARPRCVRTTDGASKRRPSTDGSVPYEPERSHVSQETLQ